MKITAFEQGDIKTLFDQMVALMGSDYKALSTSVMHDGGGSSMTLTCTETASGNTWTLTHYANGARITVSPPGASAGPGETVQFSATAANPDNTPVAGAAFTWSMVAGAGSISPGGLYTAPAKISGPASDTVRCAIDGANTWTNVVVSLHP